MDNCNYRAMESFISFPLIVSMLIPLWVWVRLLGRLSHFLIVGLSVPNILDIFHPRCFFLPLPCKLSADLQNYDFVDLDNHTKKHFLPNRWIDSGIQALATLCMLFLLLTVPASTVLFGYFIFFSLLTITMYTDSNYMLISRYVSIFAIPIGLLFSCAHYTPISFTESLIGAGFGYIFLYGFSTIFSAITHKKALGQGDLELLALIGSFIGIFGCWMSLLFGSLTGSIMGIALLIAGRQRQALIPFGPFLAFGAMLYVLFYTNIQHFIF